MPKKNENPVITENQNEQDINLEIKEEITTTTDEDIANMINDINNSMTSVLEVSQKESTSPVTQEALDKPGQDERIKCKSLFYGSLVYQSPVSGVVYTWKDIMSEIYLPFGELITMNNHREVYLNKPLIIVEDPRVIRYFDLLPKYEKLAKINRLEYIFNTGDVEMTRKYILEILDCGLREALINKIRKMYADETLVNIKLVNMLNEELKFVFNSED